MYASSNLHCLYLFQLNKFSARIGRAVGLSNGADVYAITSLPDDLEFSTAWLV